MKDATPPATLSAVTPSTTTVAPTTALPVSASLTTTRSEPPIGGGPTFESVVSSSQRTVEPSSTASAVTIEVPAVDVAVASEPLTVTAVVFEELQTKAAAMPSPWSSSANASSWTRCPGDTVRSGVAT